ncbi:CinA family protein [Sphingomonas psychrotolerans]|uniref:CinA family protein n=1 Tax=Sphingomonas psychrotolerans TaxID=1327635 RepID=A0ABU3MYQ7_9SPHN|nr:CinA family protein [Sphingomonas psychrotolerans]MDT8757440.1 CinA family protein [Sphingomonas psychrotolerans]
MTETLSPVLPDEVDAAARRLLERACDKDLAIATAESCTGGLLASLFTDVEGASHAFERGFVVYTNEAKAEMLGVPPELIESEGAVSEPVARSMAEGALRFSKAQVALAVTGFAGAGAPGDEAGLVHFACARAGRPTNHREEHFGDIGRGPVRIECLRVGLEMLSEAL